MLPFAVLAYGFVAEGVVLVGELLHALYALVSGLLEEHHLDRSDRPHDDLLLAVALEVFGGRMFGQGGRELDVSVLGAAEGAVDEPAEGAAEILLLALFEG